LRGKTVRPGLVALTAALLAACAAGEPVRTEPPRPRPVEERPPVEAPAEPLRLGVILSESGADVLRQYAELVRQGIELAIEEYARDGRPVELMVVDDRGDASRAAALTRELEARGAVAIVGPLLGASLEAAARARSSADLALLSPTASEAPDAGPNVYSLNLPDTRGAELLGRWAAQRGLTRVGTLYARRPDLRRGVEAFTTALEAGGGRVVADVPYEPGTTTFAQPLQRLRAAGVQAIFLPADERDIRQIAPQIPFYGLSNVQILGSEAWVDDGVLRSLQPAHVEGVVAAVPLLSASPDVAWGEFVRRYEAAKRRTLDNPYPALGYDAARLVLSVAGDAGIAGRAAVAGRLAQLEAYRGATGVLSLRNGRLTRRPFLVRVEGGRPVPLPGGGVP
jgi:branched-chain amino acid transport system substrate-binding protein